MKNKLIEVLKKAQEFQIEASKNDNQQEVFVETYKIKLYDDSEYSLNVRVAFIYDDDDLTHSFIFNNSLSEEEIEKMMEEMLYHYKNWSWSAFTGELKGFPNHIVKSMLDEQERQGNERNAHIFEKDARATAYGHGFEWDESEKGYEFWYKLVEERDFSDL